jgi:hypothetical protein
MEHFGDRGSTPTPPPTLRDALRSAIRAHRTFGIGATRLHSDDESGGGHGCAGGLGGGRGGGHLRPGPPFSLSVSTLRRLFSVFDHDGDGCLDLT